MRRAGWISRLLWAGALALSVSGPATLGQMKPGALAPAHAMRPPDLSFKEVQVFYPAFNFGYRLVPPGGPSQTSVLRLVENPAVAPGTKLGPDEPGGQPGPVATHACREPVRATLRVWVTNSGVAPFDATTAALGLTGTVAGQPVKAAFGKVAGGRTQEFEAGSLGLSPGSFAAVLALNTARGGSETNFANNGFESRFQIKCGCPPGSVRNAAGRCSSSPAAMNAPAPAPSEGGIAAGAQLASPAVIAAVQPTHTPTPRPTATATRTPTPAPTSPPGGGVIAGPRLAAPTP